MKQDKKYLIVILGSVAVILVLLVVGVMLRLNSEEKKVDDEADLRVRENYVTRKQVYQYLSYLDYSQNELNELSTTYQKEIATKSVEGYAIFKQGMITREEWINEDEYMKREELDCLLQAYAAGDKNYSVAFHVLDTLYEEQENAYEGVALSEFILIYDTIITEIEKLPDFGGHSFPTHQTLLILGEKQTGEGGKRLVTNRGMLRFSSARDCIDPEKKADRFTVSNYLDDVLMGLVFEDELLYVSSREEAAVSLSNVYIIRGEGKKLTAFVEGIEKNFNTIYPMNKVIENIVGDITIQNKSIIKVNIKPDMIEGKVLRTGEAFIEIEGYGRISLDEDFRIYQLVDEIQLERINRILVGYQSATFVVSGDKLCAALITQQIKAENIRVVLMTEQFQSYYHDKIQISCSGNFIVSLGEKQSTYSAKEVFEITKEDFALTEERAYIKPVKATDKLLIKSIKRSGVEPAYRGHMEIATDGEGMFIVNELPLEEYLYSVIPSEMPTFYGKEALKVQAVCARSYAYSQLLGNTYASFGAHVDDSISCQVYNNIAETESTIEAVKETYGQVIDHNGKLVVAYYYSTSAGHSNSIEDVWIGSNKVEYLKGKWQIEEGETTKAVSMREKVASYDLSEEEDFQRYLKDDTIKTYDEEFPWYRWTTTLSMDGIMTGLEDKLRKRYDANPELIKTKIDGKEEYESREIVHFGKLLDIKPVKRADSGMVIEMVLVGSEATIKVLSEYNIRYVLAPKDQPVVTKDGKERVGVELLPSAFIFIEPVLNGSKLSQIVIYGAGYGHGVGMSQNGVKAMVEQGKSYEEILKYYYEGTSIIDIY